MGLALDEPAENDETFDIDGLTVVMDPFAARIVKESEGLDITNTMFGPQAQLRGVAAGGCC